MPTLLLALFAASFGAAASLLAGRLPVLRDARNAMGYLAFHYGLMLLLVLPLFPWFFSAPHLDAGGWGMLVLALGLDVASNVLFTSSFSTEPPCRVSTLMASSPLFTLALTPLVPLAALATTARSVLAVPVIVLGVVVVSAAAAGSFRAFFRGFGRPGVWKVLLAAGLFGASVLITKPLLSSGATTPYTYFLLRCGLSALLMAILVRPKLSLLAGSLKLGVFRSAAVVCQWMLLLYAVRSGSPAVANAVGSTIPLFVLAFSWCLFGHRPSRWDAVGALLVVAGVVLLALG